MKNAYFQNVISIIKKNKVSYIAIMMFVFFSVHLYLLASYLSYDVYKSADDSYDFYKKYDVAVYAGSGIDDDIKEELLKTKGTSDVETAHISYGYVETIKGKLDTEVRTITEKFALPVDLEGRLPKKNNEIAFLKHFANFYNIKIGDIITLEKDSYTQETKFVVTALFESAQFPRKLDFSYGSSKITNNANTSIAFISKNALNNNYVNDNYIMLKNNSLDGISKFSNEYKVLCEDYIERIDDKLDILIVDNYLIERWNEDIGYHVFDNFAKIAKTIKNTLSLVLFFVAVVVLIVSISRMILDKKNEIGIMKANGFTNKEIANIFYIYSVSATIIGNVFANIFVTFFTEKIALNFASNYCTGNKGSLVFNIKDVVFIFFTTALIMVFTTYVCIKNVLDKDAIEIISKKKTTSVKIFFYEYLLLFKKLPTFVQIIINNFLKDIKRCIGIILAIIGSVMLLTSGFVINRNVYNGYEYQMKNDICFDTLLFCTPTDSTRDEVERILNKNRIDYVLCQYTYIILKNKNNKAIPFITFVYEDKDEFSKFFKFNTMNKVNHNYNGLFLQESYKKYYDLDEHGYVKIKNSKGKDIYVRTSQYIYNYIESIFLAVIDKETYEDIMDTESYMQSYIVNSKKRNLNAIYDELSDVDGYLYHIDIKKYFEEGFIGIYSFINTVVVIFIITSIFFSFLVILNLMKVNILERKNEIIILLVNGFTKKETKNYLILDMILMFVFGNVIGTILGIHVASYVLTCFTSETILFMNRINYSAIFISLIISFVICFIITKISVKEIDTININNMDD